MENRTSWGPVRLLVFVSPNYESEGVQEDNKTSSVPSTGRSHKHSRAWLTQNLGLPTEEVSMEGVKLHATCTETTCTMHKPRETSTQTT
ncbi:hypothetical protein Taro_002960 [Colocasia esculenta]|uniref:Uncharacterized protein n=1 Tax=Colocasia esculenta TaxID=4460 RepID=A0A843TFR0_COLES|nr:hypothetical protein [Colocasia esculenta]